MTTEKLLERFEVNIHLLQKKSNHNYRIELITLRFHIITCVLGESLLEPWQLTPSASERRRKRHCCFDFCVRKKIYRHLWTKSFLPNRPRCTPFCDETFGTCGSSLPRSRGFKPETPRPHRPWSGPTCKAKAQEPKSTTFGFRCKALPTFLPTTYILFLVNVAYLQFVTNAIWIAGYDRQELEAPLRSYPPLCDHGYRYGFRRSFLRPASNLLTWHQLDQVH